jgi:two-component system OmpR family sensor kinase/two-component system sensor histidine kinase QseC
MLFAVGAASLGITFWVLRSTDRQAAQSRAQTAIRTFALERAEGDTQRTAIDEVLAAADSEGVRIALRLRDASEAHGTLGPLPSRIARLTIGDCRTDEDERGDSWQGCAVASDSLDVIVAIPTQAHTRALRILALGMLSVVLLALVGAVGAVRLALRKPLDALHRLVGWTERIVESEDPAAPPPTDTEELARLAGSFDTLLHRLFGALARERANSAHIAHEFRTPLTAMRAELEAMASTSGDAVSRLRADLKRLSHVVDTILALSAPPQIDVGDIVVNLADLVRGLAPPETEIDAPDEALVRGDEHLVGLALRNLFENAERHGGRPATRIEISQVDGKIRVAVLDDGPGLPMAARAKMFDQYWRGARGGEGSGLGLALVRVVAERHGGFADASANPSGQGLEVAMTFGHVLGWNMGVAPR